MCKMHILQSTMHEVQLRSLDLNLLVIADTLFETRSVTETASRVGLSQPALSRALGRLREQLGDALLVRERRVMVLTPFAQHLRPRLRRALRELERAVVDRASFDPQTASGQLRLACADYASVAFVSHAVRLLALEAPHVELVNVPLGEPFEAQLEAEAVDLVVDHRSSRASWVRSEPLFESGWACVCRPDNLAGRRLTLERFCKAEHVMISPTGAGAGPVDHVLAALGRQRSVRARVPSFAGALAIAAQSELLLVVPEVVARAASQFMKLAVFALPFHMPAETVYLSCHVAREDEPRVAWFRGAVARVTRNGVYGASGRALAGGR